MEEPRAIKITFKGLFAFLGTPRYEHWVKTGEWDISLPFTKIDEEGYIVKEGE